MPRLAPLKSPLVEIVGGIVYLEEYLGVCENQVRGRIFKGKSGIPRKRDGYAETREIGMFAARSLDIKPVEREAGVQCQLFRELNFLNVAGCFRIDVHVTGLHPEMTFELRL